MAGTLGTIRGQMILDVRSALAAYTAARLAHLRTVTALRSGASAMMGVSAGITAVGAALVAGLVLAVNAAANFERKMDYVGAVTNATTAQMEALRNKALQLGKDTIYSAGEIADAFVELSKSGVSTQDIIDGIGEAVTNLGAAADIPLDTAANIIMSAVQTFQLGAEQAVHVADLLAGAANASIVDVQDLGVSLKYVGGVASSLGLSIEETVDAIALLGTYGIKGSTAGTSLRQILVSLTGSTGPATQALKELGIITDDGANKFFDAQGSVKSLADVFQILQDATRDLTDEQRVRYLEQIFQNRALASALDLTKAGAAGFAEMNDQISRTTAMEVASERLDNLSGDIEILRGNLETLAIEQGSSLQEFFRGIVQGAIRLVQAFSELGHETQGNILKIIGIVGAVMIVVGVFGMFAGAIMNMVAMVIMLKDAWALFRASTIAVTVAQWALNSAFLANPITWIVIAVMALIAAFVLLWKNNEGFRNFFINLWADIVTAFEAVVAWFKTIPAWWDSLWASVGESVSSVWNEIVAFFQSIPGRLMSFFLNFTLPGLLIQHWDSIKATAISVWESIVAFFQALPGRIANFFAELPGRIGYFIGFMIGTVIRLLIEFGVNAWNVITTSWDAVVNFFQELPGRVEAFFTDLYNRVINWMVRTGVDAIMWAMKTKEDIITFFSELPGRVAQFFSDLYNRVIQWMAQTAVTGAQKAEELKQNIITRIQALPGQVAAFFGELVAQVREKLSNAASTAGQMAGQMYSGVRDGISRIPSLVSGIFNDAVDAVKGMVRKAFNAVKDFANGLWEGFKDGLGIHSPSYIEHAMWAITGVLDDETQRMKGQVRGLQRLGNGIVALGSNMGDGFGTGIDQSIARLQAELNRTKEFENQLAGIAATSMLSLSTPVTAGAYPAAPPVVVEAGDNIDLDVEWHAAPNDQITTRQQLKNMLGKAKTILSDEVTV